MTRYILVLLVLATAALLGCGEEAGKPTETATATRTVTPPPGEGSPTPTAAATPTVSATPPAAVTPTPSPGTAPRPTLPPGTPVLPPGGVGAATGLQVSPTCSDIELRKGLAELTWTPAVSAGTEQRVAVTIFRDGFERDDFDVSGPLPPGQSALVWDRLEPGIIHYWRVLTLHADGWIPSETARFEGPTCVADFQ